jgi:hypothetical protein
MGCDQIYLHDSLLICWSHQEQNSKYTSVYLFLRIHWFYHNFWWCIEWRTYLYLIHGSKLSLILIQNMMVDVLDYTKYNDRSIIKCLCLWTLLLDHHYILSNLGIVLWISFLFHFLLSLHNNNKYKHWFSV